MPYIEGIKNSSDCIFCEKVLGKKGEEDLVIHRGRHAFVILNLYPYSTGHLMVVPYRHAGELTDLTSEELAEATCLLATSRAGGGSRVRSWPPSSWVSTSGDAPEPGSRGTSTSIWFRETRLAGQAIAGMRLQHPEAGCPVRFQVEDMPEPLAVTRERLRRAWAGVMSTGPHSSNS